MARPAMKALGIIGILREVLAVPLRNPRLMASVLLLLPSNFLPTFVKLSPLLAAGNIAPPSLFNGLLRRLQERSSQGGSPGVLAGPGGGPPAEVPRFEKLPLVIISLDYVVEQLTTLAMVYLSAVACKGKHSTIGVLLSKVGRTWKKVAITSLHLQLFHFAYACLFLVPAALMTLFKLPDWVAPLLVLAFFSMICFAVVFSLYLDIVCRLSLVVSAVEEDNCGVRGGCNGEGVRPHQEEEAAGNPPRGSLPCSPPLHAKELLRDGRWGEADGDGWIGGGVEICRRSCRPLRKAPRLASVDGVLPRVQ